jgi:hypothetical protein
LLARKKLLIQSAELKIEAERIERSNHMRQTLVQILAPEPFFFLF